MQVFVRLLPSLLPRRIPANTLAVVMDVLRATTTILAALDAGATAVIPCTTIQKAKQVRRNYHGRMLLGGERHGSRIAGFDLGNSPAEYTRDVVAGCEIAYTTTNGTRALDRCQFADSIMVAAFTNHSAVVDQMIQHDHVELVCAGTDGSVTLEDVWLAGSLLQELARRGCTFSTNDAGQLSWSAWQRESLDDRSGEQLAERFADTHGGRNLVALGMHDDLRFAAQWNRSASIAVYDTRAARIRLA